MEPVLKSTLCSNESFSPHNFLCWELLVYKFVVTQSVLIISLFFFSLQLQFLLAKARMQLGLLHPWRVLFLLLLLLRLVGTQQPNPPPKAGSRHRQSLCGASCGLNSVFSKV